MFRRTIHLITGLVVIYYLLPETPLGLPREIWLIILLGIFPFTIEMIRVTRSVRIPGQRPHEVKAVGSYAWSLWASMLIMLIMPQSVAVPVILVYSFADPVLSELRVWRKWSTFTFGFVFIWIMFVAFGFDLMMAAYGAIFMIIGESTEEDVNKWMFDFKTDDDGTTQVIPAIMLGIAYIMNPGLFPDPWLYPIF